MVLENEDYPGSDDVILKDTMKSNYICPILFLYIIKEHMVKGMTACRRCVLTYFQVLGWTSPIYYYVNLVYNNIILL